jgi:hypothetical protein
LLREENGENMNSETRTEQRVNLVKKEVDLLQEDFNISVYVNGKKEVTMIYASKIRIQKRIDKLVKITDGLALLIGSPTL